MQSAKAESIIKDQTQKYGMNMIIMTWEDVCMTFKALLVLKERSEISEEDTHRTQHNAIVQNLFNL